MFCRVIVEEGLRRGRRFCPRAWSVYGATGVVVNAGGADYLPAEGAGMASANADNRVFQSGIAVRKGVRVRISFKARAYNP